MDAITAGVGINLISASIQKIGSVTFQKFVKVNKVEQMIRNGAAHDPVLVEALDHFRKALLRGESSYTQDVEAFISELMKTTLLSELMDECLIGVPSESLKYAFSAICAETCGADRADELFLALVNTFRATVRVLLKDDALHVYLRAISTEIQKLRSKIALKLVPSNSQATSKQNFQKKIQNLAKHLVPSFKSIRIETNRGARIVDLSRLYLEPHLSLRRPNPAGVRMLEISRRHSVDDLGDESLLALTYKEVANSARRIVVLGDPGGGKSTLCQYLCYKVAKAAASTQSRSVRQNGRLPIRAYSSRELAVSGLLDFCSSTGGGHDGEIGPGRWLAVAG
ncbi:NACHT domain-containing protein [Indioceanicola profundi]|uniref:hypothetical protein n=1 Tax=Indioceanicola profundi TaxID=2220096 RepID=UPI0013C47BC7|nr:hypothetical protein [Indioceanicola profundi]